MFMSFFFFEVSVICHCQVIKCKFHNIALGFRLSISLWPTAFISLVCFSILVKVLSLKKKINH